MDCLLFFYMMLISFLDFNSILVYHLSFTFSGYGVCDFLKNMPYWRYILIIYYAWVLLNIRFDNILHMMKSAPENITWLTAKVFYTNSLYQSGVSLIWSVTKLLDLKGSVASFGVVSRGLFQHSKLFFAALLPGSIADPQFV